MRPIQTTSPNNQIQPISYVETLLNHKKFTFQPRRGQLDLRKITKLDVDRIAREVDIDSLQEVLENMTFSSISQEDLNLYSDDCFLRLFQTAQLTLEYLLNVQNLLASNLNSLARKYSGKKRDLERLKENLEQKDNEILHLQREVWILHQNRALYEPMLQQYPIHHPHPQPQPQPQPQPLSSPQRMYTTTMPPMNSSNSIYSPTPNPTPLRQSTTLSSHLSMSDKNRHESKIHLYIVRWQVGKCVDLSVPSNWTIENLKIEIARKTGSKTPLQDQRISLKGVLLSDSFELHTCNIVDESVLVLMDSSEEEQKCLDETLHYKTRESRSSCSHRSTQISDDTFQNQTHELNTTALCSKKEFTETTERLKIELNRERERESLLKVEIDNRLKHLENTIRLDLQREIAAVMSSTLKSIPSNQTLIDSNGSQTASDTGVVSTNGAKPLQLLNEKESKSCNDDNNIRSDMYDDVDQKKDSSSLSPCHESPRNESNSESLHNTLKQESSSIPDSRKKEVNLTSQDEEETTKPEHKHDTKEQEIDDTDSTISNEQYNKSKSPVPPKKRPFLSRLSPSSLSKRSIRSACSKIDKNEKSPASFPKSLASSTICTNISVSDQTYSLKTSDIHQPSNDSDLHSKYSNKDEYPKREMRDTNDNESSNADGGSDSHSNSQSIKSTNPKNETPEQSRTTNHAVTNSTKNTKDVNVNNALRSLPDHNLNDTKGNINHNEKNTSPPVKEVVGKTWTLAFQADSQDDKARSVGLSSLSVAESLDLSGLQQQHQHQHHFHRTKNQGYAYKSTPTHNYPFHEDDDQMSALTQSVDWRDDDLSVSFSVKSKSNLTGSIGKGYSSNVGRYTRKNSKMPYSSRFSLGSNQTKLSFMKDEDEDEDEGEQTEENTRENIDSERISSNDFKSERSTIHSLFEKETDNENINHNVDSRHKDDTSREQHEESSVESGTFASNHDAKSDTSTNITPTDHTNINSSTSTSTSTSSHMSSSSKTSNKPTFSSTSREHESSKKSHFRSSQNGNSEESTNISKTDTSIQNNVCEETCSSNYSKHDCSIEDDGQEDDEQSLVSSSYSLSYDNDDDNDEEEDSDDDTNDYRGKIQPANANGWNNDFDGETVSLRSKSKSKSGNSGIKVGKKGKKGKRRSSLKRWVKNVMHINRKKRDAVVI